MQSIPSGIRDRLFSPSSAFSAPLRFVKKDIATHAPKCDRLLWERTARSP
ncbi:hypothetical protein [Cylindrospermum stagnale]|nr:hypothetical protein [Cylindrospermum stagnale]